MPFAWLINKEKDLAHYVTPDHEVLNEVKLPDSVNALENRLFDKKKLVEGIYSALVEKNIKYDIELFNIEKQTQLVRTSREILTLKQGTCLDLAILFCGVCLKYNLLPLLIIFDNHASVAVSARYSREEYWTSSNHPGREEERELSKNPPLYDWNEFQKLVKFESDDDELRFIRFIPIECTGFVDSATNLSQDSPEGIGREKGFLSFDNAVKAGYTRLKDHKGFRFALDIALAQEHYNIKPMKPDSSEENDYISINKYLNEEIAKKPLEKVFGEEKLTFKDIYVPLKAKKVNNKGEIDDKIEPFDLEAWAKGLLKPNSENRNQVLFIQGGPGRGKSVFCRMFADWVRKDIQGGEEPELGLTPILIRLRYINEFENSLTEILRGCLRIDYTFANDDNWLIKGKKFLFILDGFDELIILESQNESIRGFIQKVEAFQRDYGRQGHRVIITGRAMALHGIGNLPNNLQRIEIAEMDAALQSQWFEKWYKIFPDKEHSLQEFLLDKDCPDYLQELSREPLLLYMLADINRKNKLKIEKIKQSESKIEAKIQVYKQALESVLETQRKDDRGNLTEILTSFTRKELENILAEVAMAITQSERDYADIKIVEARLPQDQAKKLLQQAKAKSGQGNTLSNTLTAFYIKSNGDGGSIEFFHKSFREFFCALRIQQSLKNWVKLEDKDKINQEIYDLLGYGGLTPEIVEYLFGLLDENGEFKFDKLFDKLNSFYESWCQGDFIDKIIDKQNVKTTLALEAATKYNDNGIELGLRAVDIYAGLNVMILLLELHRKLHTPKNNTTFYPSGKPKEGKLTTQLIRAINYSNCVKNDTFLALVGSFLAKANLRGANLRGANLTDANLTDANLTSANLTGANLTGANLTSANLTGANLTGADLSRADLSRADLSRADLSRAKLLGANLSHAFLIDAKLLGANLRGANLRGANLRGADLSRASLRDANLRGAFLIGADLEHADLDYADLSDANLRGAKNLTPEKVKAAENWDKAIYDLEFHEQLNIQ